MKKITLRWRSGLQNQLSCIITRHVEISQNLSGSRCHYRGGHNTLVDSTNKQEDCKQKYPVNSKYFAQLAINDVYLAAEMQLWKRDDCRVSKEKTLASFQDPPTIARPQQQCRWKWRPTRLQSERLDINNICKYKMIQIIPLHLIVEGCIDCITSVSRLSNAFKSKSVNNVILAISIRRL